MEELIDIFDGENKNIIKKEQKSVAHKLGLWHRSVHIWIYNSVGEIIIQKRVKTKNYFPGVWDLSVGGHVGAGEEPIISAIREVSEEIGIIVSEEDLEFQFIKKEQNPDNGIINNEFVYVYTFKWDGDITKLELQKEEVEQIKFIKLEQLKKDLKNKSKDFIPHQEYWFEMINIIENK